MKNKIVSAVKGFWVLVRALNCPHIFRRISLFHAGCGMGSESFETHKCSICGIYAEGVRSIGTYRTMDMVQYYHNDPTPHTHGQPIWEGKDSMQRPAFPLGLALISAFSLLIFYPLVCLALIFTLVLYCWFMYGD